MNTLLCKICEKNTVIWSSTNIGWKYYCNGLDNDKIKHNAWFGYDGTDMGFLLHFSNNGLNYRVIARTSFYEDSRIVNGNSLASKPWIAKEICKNWSIQQWVDCFNNQVLLF